MYKYIYTAPKLSLLLSFLFTVLYFFALSLLLVFLSSYVFMSPFFAGAALEIAAELLTCPRCQEETYAPTSGSYLPLSKSDVVVSRAPASGATSRYAPRGSSNDAASAVLYIGVYGFSTGSPTMLEIAFYILHDAKLVYYRRLPVFRFRQACKI